MDKSDLKKEVPQSGRGHGREGDNYLTWAKSYVEVAAQCAGTGFTLPTHVECPKGKRVKLTPGKVVPGVMPIWKWRCPCPVVRGRWCWVQNAVADTGQPHAAPELEQNLPSKKERSGRYR